MVYSLSSSTYFWVLDLGPGFFFEIFEIFFGAPFFSDFPAGEAVSFEVSSLGSPTSGVSLELDLRPGVFSRLSDEVAGVFFGLTVHRGAKCHF